MPSKLDDPVFRHERAKKASRVAARNREIEAFPRHIAHIREIVDRSRADQGLPPHITDALVLGQVAATLRLLADGGDDA
jgi:hypothetical protein